MEYMLNTTSQTPGFPPQEEYKWPNANERLTVPMNSTATRRATDVVARADAIYPEDTHTNQ